MTKFPSCPLCKGEGKLKDAVGGWDVGEPPPYCKPCCGSGEIRDLLIWMEWNLIMSPTGFEQAIGDEP